MVVIVAKRWRKTGVQSSRCQVVAARQAKADTAHLVKCTVTVKDGKKERTLLPLRGTHKGGWKLIRGALQSANIERKRQRGNWRLSPLRLKPTSKPQNMQLCAVEDRCKRARLRQDKGSLALITCFPGQSSPFPGLGRHVQARPGPCSCQLHPLASQWLTAKFRTASMLAVNFFRSRTKDSYCSSITRLPPSPSITPSHPYLVCFCCDSPSCFREGCYFLLIRPFQDDGDTAFSCCRSSPDKRDPECAMTSSANTASSFLGPPQ
jgi:hypothetical protein